MSNLVPTLYEPWYIVCPSYQSNTVQFCLHVFTKLGYHTQRVFDPRIQRCATASGWTKDSQSFEY